ncbi:MAG: hypothetical protein KAT44_11965, partial [Pirellulales bacterium]|nr:hypothetical protein [Pirellulales bacterium]
MVRFHTTFGILLSLLFLSGNISTLVFSAEEETANKSEITSTEIPPVPKGTPEELLTYIRTIRQNAAQPTSREEMMKSMQAVATATVEAAERALSQLKESDELFTEAATAKLQSLMMLSRLGDTNASSELQSFAKSMIDRPSPALAIEAKRLLLVQQAQELFTKRDLVKAPAIIKQAGDLLTANPDDAATAGLAMQLASAFEHMPGGEVLSKQAYETFGPIFEKSKNDSIRQMA